MLNIRMLRPQLRTKLLFKVCFYRMADDNNSEIFEQKNALYPPLVYRCRNARQDPKVNVGSSL